MVTGIVPVTMCGTRTLVLRRRIGRDFDSIPRCPQFAPEENHNQAEDRQSDDPDDSEYDFRLHDLPLSFCRPVLAESAEKTGENPTLL